jgi:crossover junction endodeoxyribonuclease RuvC
MPSVKSDLMNRPNCVLGVDPGLNRTGYAILERSPRSPVLREGGVIRSSAGLSLAERVLELGRALKEVIEEFHPQVLAIEQVFSTTKFPKTAILMAHARGALLYAAADAGIPVVHYTPTQVKRLLTGSGNASKEQIQHAIRQELGLDRILEPNDVADAFAVALCHYHSARNITLCEQTSVIDDENEFER